MLVKNITKITTTTAIIWYFFLILCKGIVHNKLKGNKNRGNILKGTLKWLNNGQAL